MVVDIYRYFYCKKLYFDIIIFNELEFMVYIYFILDWNWSVILFKEKFKYKNEWIVYLAYICDYWLLYKFLVIFHVSEPVTSLSSLISC